MLTVQRLESIDRAALTQRGQSVPADVAKTAADIIADVAARGADALRHWTHALDQADLDDPCLDAAAWQAGADACPAHVKSAIDGNLERIRAFHSQQVPADSEMEIVPGLALGRRAVPLAAVACYVPGGRAAYPSTVLMTVVPAVLAGVARIVVLTPPRPDGSVDPSVLYAAQAAGATHVVRAGGAQAIAAAALGTKHIAAVDCIVGPGNAFVTAAKQQLQSRVRIDSPAGPSELLVLADETANPAWVAADMVAQAEHDPDAQCILVATTEAVAQSVADELARLADQASRSEIVQASLRDHGALLVATAPQAIQFANEYAAEHLEIHMADADTVARQITNAGSIFIGPHTPVPLGDYGSGTNHVLPTMGHARTTGGLGVESFMKWITWQRATPAGLEAVADDVATLARAEGLDGHAAAVEARQ